MCTSVSTEREEFLKGAETLKNLKEHTYWFFFFHLIKSNKSTQAFNDIPLCLEVREHVRARPQALALNGFTHRSGIVAGVSWLQITLCDFIQKSGRESRSLLSGVCVAVIVKSCEYSNT